MKRDQKAKMNLNLNPITGLPNENKRYYYPKPDETEAASEEERENCSEIDDAKIAMVL